MTTEQTSRAELDNDAAVIDYVVVTGIDEEGDERETVIVLTYDADEMCYTVEKTVDGQSVDSESFDGVDAAEAARVLHQWTKQTENDYLESEREFNQTRVTLAAEALQHVLEEYEGDLAPTAEVAIRHLARLIQTGNAGQAATVLASLVNTIKPS